MSDGFAELYDEDVFEGQLPVWFVVAKGVTEFDPGIGRLRLASAEPWAFCGGMVGESRCLAVFSDEDLAERHASRYDTAAVCISDLAELKGLLRSFYPNGFDSVIIDPGDSEWTRTKKPIPEFIASFRMP